MSQAVREANRRADRAESALRAAQRKLEAVEHARLGGGPILRLLRLYDDLDLAADPVKGRTVEAGGAAHPFDRPMPHLSTLEARELQRTVDRALFRVCDVIADWLNSTDQTRGIRRDVCPGCGGPVNRTGRPAKRRQAAVLFLQLNLKHGPQPEETVLAAARQLDISRDTLRRAAKDAQVTVFDQDGLRCWRLPGEL